MANRTTGSPKSQERSMRIAAQSQLAKIKREEEEELWISGEELYTEGSSDEEEYKTQLRIRRKVNNNGSRSCSTNRSPDWSDVSSISTEIVLKTDHSKNEHKEQKSMPKDTLTDKQSSENLDRPMSMESRSIERLSTTESSTTLITKSSADFKSEEDKTEDNAISWKAKRELYSNEEMVEEEYEDVSDVLRIDTEDECMRKEILVVRSLDNLMCAMNTKVKKANEETLFYQCKYRKRLEEILTLNPSETGKLAENTRQFFYLCPRYTIVNEEFQENNKSYISPESNDFEQHIFQNSENANFDEEFLESINNKTQDPNSNEYVVHEKVTEILLTTPEEQSLSNVQEPLLEEYDSVSNTCSVTSIPHTMSAMKISQDIDYLTEGRKEMDDSSILMSPKVNYVK